MHFLTNMSVLDTWFSTYEPGGWEATFLVGKPSLSSLTCGTCNGKRSIVEYQIFDR